MRNRSLLSIAEELLRADYIQFIMHTHPDGDTFGSCIAAACLCEAAGKVCDLVCADKIPEQLKDLSSRLTFLPSDGIHVLEAKKGKKLVCAIDVASPKQFGQAGEYYLPRTDFVIDHHEYGTPAADYYIDKNAAAAGEIIYDLAKVFLRLKAIKAIPREALEGIYVAISSDTGGFRFSNTTAATHKIASKIMDAGIDCADLEYRLHIRKPQKQIEAERIVYNMIEPHLEGKLSAVVIDNVSRRGTPTEYFDCAVDIARSVKGAAVGCSIKEDESKSGEYRVSLRSDGKTDVASVAAKFGGGGHFAAAGCTLVCNSSREALELVIKEVENAL